MNLLIQMTATAVKPIELLQKYRVYRMDMAQMIVKPMLILLCIFPKHRFYYTDRNKQNIDK